MTDYLQPVEKLEIRNDVHAEWGAYSFGDPVSSGTTLCAVSFNGGVILGADTRTSAGGFVMNRASRKITPITESIFVMRSGSAADTQAITGFVKRATRSLAVEMRNKGIRPEVSTVAALFRMYCYEHKDQLSCSVIVAGVDDVKGAQIHAVPLGGTHFRDMNYAVAGSGSIHINNYVAEHWTPELTEDEARRLVQAAVSRACHQDSSSGGMVRTITVKLDGEVVETTSILKDDVPLRLTGTGMGE